MRVCMLGYTFYDFDNRVRRYSETLIKRGDQVDVIALKRQGQCPSEIVQGVKVFRIQERVKNETNNLTYLFRLLIFLLKSFVFLSYKHWKKPYDLIHVHSVPDFEVFAALIPKVLGAKIILDIHDIVPEFYESKFGSNKKSLIFKSLVFVEKVSISFSDHVIISNHIWYDTLISRSVNESKCTTIMNYPDNSKFYKRDKIRNEKKFKILYPGTINWHQGLDIAVKAFALIKDQAPHAEFQIYGGGPAQKELIFLINKLGLENRVFLKDSVPISEIADIMANSNLGVIPKRNDCFGGEAFSTKTLEFMSLGVPIIVSKTKIDQYYFDESIVKFFEPENEKDLAEAMLLLINNKEMRNKLVQNALRFIKKNNWDVKKNIYLDLVDSLK
jgi:glycosyltransferase involved in cell wall biosynthesis